MYPPPPQSFPKSIRTEIYAPGRFVKHIPGLFRVCAWDIFNLSNRGGGGGLRPLKVKGSPEY